MILFVFYLLYGCKFLNAHQSTFQCPIAELFVENNRIPRESPRFDLDFCGSMFPSPLLHGLDQARTNNPVLYIFCNMKAL